MAEEKLNVGPEENPQPSLFDAGPAEIARVKANAEDQKTTRPGGHEGKEE